MAHLDLETAGAAEAGLAELPENLQKLYRDVILSGLPELARRTLEGRMIKGYEYQSDFARKYYSQGLQQGREEGREEGREDGLRRAIFALVCARLPGLRDELESRLRGQSAAQLEQLITELLEVHDEAGVRAVLDEQTRLSGV